MATTKSSQAKCCKPEALARPVVLPGLTRQKEKAAAKLLVFLPKQKQKAAAKLPVVLPRTKQKRKAESEQHPALRKSKVNKKRAASWNKGRKHSQTSKQHAFILAMS